MASTIDTIITEIKNSLKAYDAASLIDDASIYDWTFKALKRFGNLITTMHDVVVDVKDGKGTLPINYLNLKTAIKCEPLFYRSDFSKDELQSTYFWKERVEKTSVWGECADCDKTYSEKKITEKIYLHGKETALTYGKPVLLKLGKYINKDAYAPDCDNRFVKDCPHEITINNYTLSANFKEGSVFIRFYGFEIDEDNKPYIPESPHERLETYLTYHIKRKIFEDIWLNGDDTGIENKIQYLLSQEKEEFGLALTDVKANTLTLQGFKNLEKQNRRRVNVFELNVI